MDNSTEGVRSSANVVRCFDGLNGCCSMMHRSYSGTWLRSVKRITDEFEQEDDIINLNNNNNNAVSIPDLAFSDVARVEVANECIALREMVSNQQKTIQDLTLEIEEERNASSSAANEAMSMILRLQREKAEIQMEARQFKRFTEEKISHDLQELSAMEECLYKRDQTVQSLNCEVQAYKHRLMSFGLTESEADDTADLISIDDYPPLKCSNNETRSCSEIEYDVTDIDKYAFGETPRTPKDFEFKMSQFERSPKNGRRPRHFRRISTGSSNSLIASIKEMNADFNMDSSSPRFRKMGSMTKSNTMSNLGKAVSSTKTSDIGDEDDMSDRVYTIDSINVSSSETPKAAATAVAAANEVVVFDDDYAKKTKECGEYEGSTNDPEIKKLYVRLQELEADRESMRQSILSMRTDKAQLVLLKEVAQHLCKDMSPSARTMAASKQSQVHGSSFKSIFKWIACFITWRKQARRSKYNFGSSNKNAVGLLALLEKANVPRAEHRRYTRLITQHLGSI